MITACNPKLELLKGSRHLCIRVVHVIFKEPLDLFDGLTTHTHDQRIQARVGVPLGLELLHQNVDGSFVDISQLLALIGDPERIETIRIIFSSKRTQVQIIICTCVILKFIFQKVRKYKL